MEKCGIFWKNGRFSGQIWPDWENTAWADMAGLGSIGLRVMCVMPVTSQAWLVRQTKAKSRARKSEMEKY